MPFLHSVVLTIALSIIAVNRLTYPHPRRVELGSDRRDVEADIHKREEALDLQKRTAAGLPSEEWFNHACPKRSKSVDRPNSFKN